MTGIVDFIVWLSEFAVEGFFFLLYLTVQLVGLGLIVISFVRTYLFSKKVGAALGTGDFENVANLFRGFWWWVRAIFAWCFIEAGFYLIGVESPILRLVMLFAFFFFGVALAAGRRSWWILESVFIVGVVAGFYEFLVSADGIGFENRIFWLLAIVALGTCCMAMLTRGPVRFGFGGVTGAIVAASIFAFLHKGTFADGAFWVLAGTATVSAVMILFSRQIVHMAFWLLTTLACVAGFYLLLGADFLGFVQVLVYIGGILILFLFGVMLTHRMDVPLGPTHSVGVILPGIVVGLGVTVLLVFIASGNNWAERAPQELTSIAPNTQLSRYYDANANAELGREAAESTSFGIGTRFMSTYLLPFEVVSVLLLVAMIGATYIARGRSEDDSAGSDLVVEGGAE